MFLGLLSLETDVRVPLGNKLGKKVFFGGILEVTDDKSRIRIRKSSVRIQGLTSTFYYVYLMLENKLAKVKRKDPDLKNQNPYRQRFRPCCILLWIRIFSLKF
jgi:hypothetical protein